MSAAPNWMLSRWSNNGAPVVGRHYWDGALADSIPADWSADVETFSVGVFPAEKGFRGVKRGKAVVRVSGKRCDMQRVFDTADTIACQLDRGEYKGPKSVRVRA